MEVEQRGGETHGLEICIPSFHKNEAAQNGAKEEEMEKEEEKGCVCVGGGGIHF